jgi:hypothetical protein
LLLSGFTDYWLYERLPLLQIIFPELSCRKFAEFLLFREIPPGPQLLTARRCHPNYCLCSLPPFFVGHFLQEKHITKVIYDFGHITRQAQEPAQQPGHRPALQGKQGKPGNIPAGR